MIAQALLSVLLGGVLVYAWAEYRRSPLVGALSIVAGLAGLYFVWMPSHSTLVAEFVGIGRGVDLILYLWVCISLTVMLNLHLKLRAQQETITKLARSIATANLAAAQEAPAVKAEEAPQPGPPAAADAHTSRQMRGQSA
jgi:small membrane protein